MGKYFGTDGFRGEVNVTLTAEHAFKIGRFLGWYYGERIIGKKCKIAIGKDPRRSSYMFEYSLAGGLTASGADVYLLHVTTTPSVSYAVRTEEFDCGVMISASHNSYFDNGIKLVNAKGEKMEDEIISEIEKYLDGDTPEIPLALDDKIGCTIDWSAGRNRYIGYLISLATRSLRGMRIGLDCANGSSWMIAKSVFDALGAKTYVINDSPNGLNINKNCGSTDVTMLKNLVAEKELDVGFAFDGDADRCIAVDSDGRVIDGDHIIYVCAKYMKDNRLLEKNTVVTTVMSNIGLYKALDKLDIRYIQTSVGDKYVYEAMSAGGYRIGGEASGHVIFSKYATTGDGILTSIKLVEAVLETKTPLNELVRPLKIYPQTLVNVEVTDKIKASNDADLLSEVEAVANELGANGRVLVRASGTESVVRVMIEAETDELCRLYNDRLVQKLEKYRP